jgi:hypothetical protein
MVHISQHIPEDEVKKLIKVLQILCTDDILANLKFAVQWYRELTGKSREDEIIRNR